MKMLNTRLLIGVVLLLLLAATFICPSAEASTLDSPTIVGAISGTAIMPTAQGGTGVNNGSSTITIGGNTAFSGAHTFTGTLTGDTGVTFPTAGTLTTTTGTISNGTTVAVSNSASYYPALFASSSNSSQPFNLGSGLTFNPSTNVLATTTFSGALNGSLTQFTTAVTQPYIDSSTRVANTFFTQTVARGTMATFPMAITGGTYSFASLGNGATVTYVASGGVVTSATAPAGGSGYKVGDLLTTSGAVGAGNYDVLLRVATVSGTAVATYSVVYGGTGYTSSTGIGTTPAQSGGFQFELTGTLTSNATIIVPNGTYLAQSNQWIVANGTTGAYATTFYISNGSDAPLGSGIVAPQGVGDLGKSFIDTDGVSVIGCAGGACQTVVGVLTIGTWNASVISPAYGGTGVANNAASTLTISGAYPTTLTVSGTTTLTLPTSGTVTALGNTVTGSGGTLVEATSPTFVTSITDPIQYGGTAAGSTLTLNGTSNGSPSNAYVLLNPAGGGNVGIGTATPAGTLDVYGSIYINDQNGISYPSTDSTVNASIAIGSGALVHEGSLASAGYHATAVGYQTLNSATMTSAALNNTAVGYIALHPVTSGTGDTGIGAYALQANTGGSRNTALGYNAGGAINSGAGNLALGYSVGGTLTTGGSNILIGIGTVGVAGGSDVASSSTSNFLNIGNTLEGSMANSNALGGETLYLTSAANSVNYINIIGGATTVAPTISAAGTDTNSNLNLSAQGTGNVNITVGGLGIGSTLPRATLDVSQSTGAIILPIGTTGQEPASPVAGMIRYNSTVPQVEAYVGSAWTALGAGGGGSVSITAASSNLVVSPSPITGTGTVDLAAAPSIVTSLTSPYINVTTVGTGYEIAGGNAINFPSTDSTAGASIAIGSGALAQEGSLASTAFGNTAVGYQSLNSASMTTGAIQNTSLGYQTLRNNTTGKADVVIGYQALLNNTTGSSNVAVGYASLLGNTTGQDNVAIGLGAGYSNVSGNYSTAVGHNAMYYANNTTTGFTTYNTAVGAFALEGYFTASANTGIKNTAVGYQALLSTTSGGSNVAIGYNNLPNNTTGSSNTAIGRQVGDTVSTGSGNVLIGAGISGDAGGSDVATSSTSNFLNIGNTLEGSMVNSTAIGAETLYLNSVASSVNHVRIDGAATNGSPKISADGTDTNIWLSLAPKAAGGVVVTATSGATCSGAPAGVCLAYATGAGHISTGASDSLTFERNGVSTMSIGTTGVVSISGITYPTTNGTNLQVLQTNGSGAASWASQSSIVGFSNGNTVQAQNTTYYMGPSCLAPTYSNTCGTVTPYAFTSRNFTVYVNTGPASGQTYTYTLQNGYNTNGNETCTISFGSQSCTDATHTDSIAAGAILSVKVVTSATSGSVYSAASIEADRP